MSEHPIAGTHVGGCNKACGEAGHFLRAATPSSSRMVVTDCCGQLLPESQTLVGDAHFSDLCPACSWLDGREHDRHVTCDWSQGIECPSRDWSYVDGRVIPPRTGGDQ